MMTLGWNLKKCLVIPIFLLPRIAIAEGLELGVEDPNKVVSAATQFPFANLVLVLFSAYLILGISLILFFLFKKRLTWRPPVLLENLPISAKSAITLALISYGFVHALALLEVYLVTRISFKSSSEYFYYMKLPKLAATSHAHLFGHGTMYLITSLIFVFSNLSELWKVIFIGLAMSAGLLDVPSWWAIKYGGGEYELFSAIAGTMSVIGWGSMAARITFEMWRVEFTGNRK